MVYFFGFFQKIHFFFIVTALFCLLLFLFWIFFLRKLKNQWFSLKVFIFFALFILLPSTIMTGLNLWFFQRGLLVKLNFHVKNVLDQASFTKIRYLNEKIQHLLHMAKTIDGLIFYFHKEYEKHHKDDLLQRNHQYSLLFPKLLGKEEGDEKFFNFSQKSWYTNENFIDKRKKNIYSFSSFEKDYKFFEEFQHLILHYLQWFSSAQYLDIHVLLLEKEQDHQSIFIPIIEPQGQSLMYLPYPYHYGQVFSRESLGLLVELLKSSSSHHPKIQDFLFYPFSSLVENFRKSYSTLRPKTFNDSLLGFSESFMELFDDNQKNSFISLDLEVFRKKPSSFLLSPFFHEFSLYQGSFFYSKIFFWKHYLNLFPGNKGPQLFMKSIDVFSSSQMGHFTFFAPRGNFLLLLFPIQCLNNTFLLLALPMDHVLVESVRQGLSSQGEYKFFLEKRDSFLAEYSFYFLLLSFGLMAIAIVLGLLFTRGLVGPTSYLIQEAENIQKDLVTPLESFQGFCLPQLRNLLKIFHHMICKIRENHQELEETNALLQERQHLLSQALLLIKERHILLSGILQGDSSGIVAMDPQGILQLYNFKAQEFFQRFLGKKITIIPKETKILDFLPSLHNLLDKALKTPNKWVHEQLEFSNFSEKKTFHFHCCLVDNLTDIHKDIHDNIYNRPSLSFSHGFFDNQKKDIFFQESQDNPKILVITFDDISALIAMEKKNAWMEIAQRLTHEIKNPLTPIGLSAERLQRRFSILFEGPLASYDFKDKTIVQDCLETIIRQTKNIGSLISQFSCFSNIQKMNKNFFDLGALFRRLLHFYQESYGHFVFLYEGPSSLMFWGNEGQLEQVMINIIKNALESMEEKRQHERSLGNEEKLALRIFLREKNHGVYVHCRDEGRGLSLETLKNLHQKLRGLQNLSLSTKRNGMGLGLLIVESILSNYESSLFFHRHKKGLHVFFILPHKK